MLKITQEGFDLTKEKENYHLRITIPVDNFKEIIQCEKNFKVKNENPIKNNPEWTDDLPPYEYHPINWVCIPIHFENQEVKTEFLQKLGLSPTKKSDWFPEKPIHDRNDVYWDTEKPVINNVPIYVITKGRWEKKLTYDTLKEMNCNFKMVIEEDEVENYIQSGVSPDEIIVFTNEEKQHYSQNGDFGSIPVRNFVLDYSKSNNETRHWIVDDNIKGFFRFYHNERIKIMSPVCFNTIEDFTDRYTNLYLSGMNYLQFCPSCDKRRKCIQMNTRIYSCILIRNDIPERWRGGYNEDTDLSLRILKRGLPTCLFNVFLCGKQTTMSCKGGNTDTIYKDNGLEKKLQSLLEQHPDVVTETYRFKKVHHMVNYKPFEKNKLEKKKKYKINKYELKLITI